MDSASRKTRVAALSVLSNTVLVMAKLAVGLWIGSVSVLSEAIHSGVDLLAAVIALFAVRSSAKGEDENHPFGHGKIENISGTVEAALIFVAAGWIIFEATKKLLYPEPLDAVGWGAVVMLVSSVVNFAVSHQLFKVGRETESPALQADAWHLRTDVYTSMGVMVGLTLIALGEHLYPGAEVEWIDPVAGIVVALLIIKAAWDLTVESGRDLLDARLAEEDETAIEACLQEFYPEVQSYHRLRTRKAGSDRFVYVHIQVDGQMTVTDSHELHDRIVRRLKQLFPTVRVYLHIEPFEEPPKGPGVPIDELPL